MGAARAKGTKFENEVLLGLRRVWPDAVEAKHRKRWAIPDWVRKLRAVAGDDDRWALVVASGDRRAKDSSTLMIVDWSFGQDLLEAWKNK